MTNVKGRSLHHQASYFSRKPHPAPDEEAMGHPGPFRRLLAFFGGVGSPARQRPAPPVPEGGRRSVSRSPSDFLASWRSNRPDRVLIEALEARQGPVQQPAPYTLAAVLGANRNDSDATTASDLDAPPPMSRDAEGQESGRRRRAMVRQLQKQHHREEEQAVLHGARRVLDYEPPKLSPRRPVLPMPTHPAAPQQRQQVAHQVHGPQPSRATARLSYVPHGLPPDLPHPTLPRPVPRPVPLPSPTPAPEQQQQQQQQEQPEQQQQRQEPDALLPPPSPHPLTREALALHTAAMAAYKARAASQAAQPPPPPPPPEAEEGEDEDEAAAAAVPTPWEWRSDRDVSWHSGGAARGAVSMFAAADAGPPKPEDHANDSFRGGYAPSAVASGYGDAGGGPLPLARPAAPVSLPPLLHSPSGRSPPPRGDHSVRYAAVSASDYTHHIASPVTVSGLSVAVGSCGESLLAAELLPVQGPGPAGAGAAGRRRSTYMRSAGVREPGAGMGVGGEAAGSPDRGLQGSLLQRARTEAGDCSGGPASSGPDLRGRTSRREVPALQMSALLGGREPGAGMGVGGEGAASPGRGLQANLLQRARTEAGGGSGGPSGGGPDLGGRTSRREVPALQMSALLGGREPGAGMGVGGEGAASPGRGLQANLLQRARTEAGGGSGGPSGGGPDLGGRTPRLESLGLQTSALLGGQDSAGSAHLPSPSPTGGGTPRRWREVVASAAVHQAAIASPFVTGGEDSGHWRPQQDSSAHSPTTPTPAFGRGLRRASTQPLPPQPSGHNQHPAVGPNGEPLGHTLFGSSPYGSGAVANVRWDDLVSTATAAAELGGPEGAPASGSQPGALHSEGGGGGGDAADRSQHGGATPLMAPTPPLQPPLPLLRPASRRRLASESNSDVGQRRAGPPPQQQHPQEAGPAAVHPHLPSIRARVSGSGGGDDSPAGAGGGGAGGERDAPASGARPPLAGVAVAAVAAAARLPDGGGEDGGGGGGGGPQRGGIAQLPVPAVTRSARNLSERMGRSLLPSPAAADDEPLSIAGTSPQRPYLQPRPPLPPPQQQQPLHQQQEPQQPQLLQHEQPQLQHHQQQHPEQQHEQPQHLQPLVRCGAPPEADAPPEQPQQEEEPPPERRLQRLARVSTPGEERARVAAGEAPAMRFASAKVLSAARS